jgi:hypothetical protein
MSECRVKIGQPCDTAFHSLIARLVKRRQPCTPATTCVQANEHQADQLLECGTVNAGLCSMYCLMGIALRFLFLLSRLSSSMPPNKMFLVVAISQFFFHVVFGIPMQNNNTNAIATSPQKVGWTSTPHVRGTFDLLLLCLTTLFLCAWTAYHPNVQVGRSNWRKTAHRCVWMLVAIFVPEAVLWCAWEQWWAAKNLMVRVNEAEKSRSVDEGMCSTCEVRACDVDDCSKEESVRNDGITSTSSTEAATNAIEHVITENPRESASISLEHSSSPTWTRETAFFALSGGLALPHPDPTKPPLSLTPTGILLLHRLRLLPPLSPPNIADKSKADAIAKALVCLQAAWFLLQCLARAVKRLPVTSLEIHVLAHVLCAFAIYTVWWGKGYDVGLPMVLEGEETGDLGALFALGGDEVSAKFWLRYSALGVNMAKVN